MKQLDILSSIVENEIKFIFNNQDSFTKNFIKFKEPMYPAVSLIHGVTPIKVTKRGGYRNSLVFYPLRLGLSNSQDTKGE